MDGIVSGDDSGDDEGDARVDKSEPHIDCDFATLAELARFLPECISVDDARAWDGVSVTASQHPSLLQNGGATGTKSPASAPRTSRHRHSTTTTLSMPPMPPIQVIRNIRCHSSAPEPATTQNGQN